MRKSDLVVEFQKRFELPDVMWNKFLSEIEEGIPLKDICEKYNLNYNATRYLFYSLSLDISSKAKRKQSIMELYKDLAKENGEGYDLVEALEKELEIVLNKNRKLNKSLTVTRDENNNLRRISRIEDRAESKFEKEYSFIENLLAGVLNKAPEKYTPIELPLNITHSSDLLTLYPYTDLHLAMLALKEISGYNYDLKIARKWILGSFDYLIKNSPNAETCLIAEMGDLLHANDDSKMTVSGHQLDVDSRHSKIIETTFEIMIELVEKALTKHKYVKVLSVSGNHSENSSHYLKAVLKAYFRNEPRVEIVGDSRLAQYYHFDKVLLGFHHGHTIRSSTKLVECMISDNIEIFSNTKYRYWNIGHLHSNHKFLSKEDALCSIEIHKNLAPRDAWADGAGYRGNVGEVKAITYHKSYGEISRNIFKIDMLEDYK